MLTANSRYVVSRNAARSTTGPALRGGSLVRTAARIAADVTSTTRPMALTVHAKPMRGSSCCAMSGNTMPPVPPPHADSEMATLRRRENHVDRLATVGAKTTPQPRPWHRPCARNSCQYVRAALVAKMPASCSRPPTTSAGR